MMDIYLQLMPTLGGYLVNSSSLHLPRIELFAQEVARSEKAFFQQRAFEENIPDYDPEKYREEYYRVRCFFILNCVACVIIFLHSHSFHAVISFLCSMIRINLEYFLEMRLRFAR